MVIRWINIDHLRTTWLTRPDHVTKSTFGIENRPEAEVEFGTVRGATMKLFPSCNPSRVGFSVIVVVAIILTTAATASAVDRFPVSFYKYSLITACTVVQAVVKATSQSNGKGQILTPWGSETSERISMKLGIYNRVAGMPAHANPCGAATTWVV